MKRALLAIGTTLSLLAPSVASAVMMPSSPSLVVTVHGPATPQSAQPGSQRIPLLTLDFTNETKQEVSIETLRVLHRGLGERRDIVGVYLMTQYGERLSDRFAFGSDGVAEIRIWPALSLPASDTMTVYVLGDIATDAAIAGEHRLWLSSDADVDAGETAVIVRQGSAQSGFVRTAGVEQSFVDVDYPGLNERIRYGKNRLVGRLRLTAEGRDDQLVSSITLTSDAKARAKDLQNIFIESSRGIRLTDIAPMLTGRGKDSVTLTFKTPLRLEDGSPMILNVRADALASRNRTIQLIVEEPGDIRATTKGR